MPEPVDEAETLFIKIWDFCQKHDIVHRSIRQICNKKYTVFREYFESVSLTGI